MSDDKLFTFVREYSSRFEDLDKKQLQFNPIIQIAKLFYNNPLVGVRELVDSCRKTSTLYIKKEPMWASLHANYGWMLNE